MNRTDFNYSKADRSITKKRKSNYFACLVSDGAQRFEMLPAERARRRSELFSVSCSSLPEGLKIQAVVEVGGPLCKSGPGELALRGLSPQQGLRPSVPLGLWSERGSQQLFLVRLPSPVSTWRRGSLRTQPTATTNQGRGPAVPRRCPQGRV